MAKNRVVFSLVCLTLFLSAAHAQEPGTSVSVVHPNQEVIIGNLRSQPNATSTVASAIETVLRNTQVCCGKDSALGETSSSDEHLSLQELGNRLSGRHTLPDGRVIVITADYLPASSVTGNRILAPLLGHQPMLMQWNSRLFVVFGASYDETIYTDGHRDYMIRKILLLDPAASGSNRETAFDRQKDDWSKVQGLLLLKTKEP